MVRTIYLVFGAISYLIFFATFLYLVAFVSGVPVVPRTVDAGGPITEPLPAVVIDVLLIAVFGLQHSVMARPAFKRRWTRIVPVPVERSVYVLFASMALMILFSLWRPMPAVIWSVESPPVAALLWALFGLGWLIVLFSTFLMSHFELFGLKQVWGHMRGAAPVAPKFRTPFFYRLVRHPLYSGFIIAFWSTPHMTAGHLLLAVGMTFYIVVAIRHEERDLVDLFGQQYAEYRVRVGMLTPKLPR